jgi:UbiD family decarboxylase
VQEGPFGEWTGYYASGARAEHPFAAEAVYHRDAPLLLGAPPAKPPHETLYGRSIMKSADLEDELTTLGIKGIRGVWFHPAGGTRLMVVIKVDTLYAGHSRQVGLAASSAPTGALMGRWIITVDPDVDYTDLAEVVWAVLTRADVATAYQMLADLWTSQLDPIAVVNKRPTASRMFIDACIPFEQRATFPRVIRRDAAQLARARALLAQFSARTPVAR